MQKLKAWLGLTMDTFETFMLKPRLKLTMPDSRPNMQF